MLFDVSAHPVVASGAYMVKIARVRVSQEQPVIIIKSARLNLIPVAHVYS